MARDDSTALEGFMLVLPGRDGSYRGVDREPFEPLLPATGAIVPVDSERVSDYYPAGWKRSLYQLAEENAIGEHGFLFRDLTPALAIQRELAAHVGAFELLAATITPPGQVDRDGAVSSAYPFMGYDIAYLGGDFYSAIKNGLIVNPDLDLVAEFGRTLNAYGLFDTRASSMRYLEEFLRTSLTERASRFYCYALRLVLPGPLPGGASVH